MVFDFASEEKLLDIDAICAKLSISRTTFERLRRPNQPQSQIDRVRAITGNPTDDFSGMPAFPEPTIMLGRSPRWSASILNRWLATTSAVNLARPFPAK